jgi:hypothetical protein
LVVPVIIIAQNTALGPATYANAPFSPRHPAPSLDTRDRRIYREPETGPVRPHARTRAVDGLSLMGASVGSSGWLSPLSACVVVAV